jgi:hypothetical protein
MYPAFQRWITTTTTFDRFNALFGITVVLGTCIIAQYHLIALFVDPFGSVAKATRACVIPNGAHQTTGPLVGVLRDMGVFVGAGLGLSLRPGIVLHWPATLWETLMIAAWRLVAGHAIMRGLSFVVAQIDTSGHVGFFSAHAFLSFALFGFAMITLIPSIFQTIEAHLSRLLRKIKVETKSQ